MDNPAGWQEKAAPLALHGDSGTFTRGGESVVVISWSSLLHQGETWSTILCIAIPKNAMVADEHHNTLDTICSILAHEVGLVFTPIDPFVEIG